MYQKKKKNYYQIFHMTLYEIDENVTTYDEHIYNIILTREQKL